MTLTPHIKNILKNSKKDTEWKKEEEERQAARKESKKAGLVATQLAYYMAVNKISQTDLGKMIGVKPQQISKILKGRENLTLATIEKIEEALGIDLIQVVNQEHKKNEEKGFETAYEILQLAEEKYQEAERVITEIYTLQAKFKTNIKIIDSIKAFKIQEFENQGNYSDMEKSEYSFTDQPTPYGAILEVEDVMIVAEPHSVYSKYELEEG
jgi:transcriptional regulator with XRE-family HTH domain